MPTIAPALTAGPKITPIPAETAKPAHRGFDFGDLLDVINPLQHLPVVGTLYRRLTGDGMSPTAEIFGGALFGGIMGVVASIADVVWTQATGKDFGNTVVSWLGFDGKDSPVQVALDAEPASAARANQSLALASPARPPSPVSGPFDPGLPALIGAMEKEGVDPAVALRAAAAYRSAIGLQRLSLPEFGRPH